MQTVNFYVSEQTYKSSRGKFEQFLGYFTYSVLVYMVVFPFLTKCNEPNLSSFKQGQLRLSRKLHLM